MGKDLAAAVVISAGAVFSGHWQQQPVAFSGHWEEAAESKADFRRQLYWEACERAKQYGETTYYSDGGEGTKLPIGGYRLVWKNSTLYYEEDSKIAPHEDGR